MTKQDYIDYLNDTALNVYPYIHELIKEHTWQDRGLYEIIMKIVERRKNKPLLKPALLRASFELCGGSNWKDIIPVCAAFELINISSYQANASFDNKFGTLIRQQRDSNFIAAMCTRELAQKCIMYVREIYDTSIINWLYDAISESNSNIYVAQHYDLNLLNTGNYHFYLDEDRFIEDYRKRCYYGSGIFTGRCAAAGAILTTQNVENVEKLKDFGELYGTGLHMINDLGDYVPNSASLKDYQDQFSDILNGRLTLPLYYLMKAESDYIHSVLTKMEISKDDQIKLSSLLNTSGIVSKVKESVNEYMKKAMQHIDVFQGFNGYDLLCIMNSICKSNKYYYYFKHGGNDVEKNC